MRQNFWCLLFLIVCLAAVLVKSESFAEVDEDGNEIEVKRFYIEGRQLNGGRRQCVETRRRKRAYNYGQADEAVNDEIPTSPETGASDINTAVSMDEMDEDDNKDNEPIALIGLYNDTNTNADQNMQDTNAGEADEGEEEEEEDEQGAEAMLSLPVIAQITHSNSPKQSAVGPAPAPADNGIVIVNTNKPPKVNPQTHAVFELRPVQADEGAGDDTNEDDDYDDDENTNLLYQEEISPVSTTAIWSTGEDDDRLGNLYDDYDAADNNVDENTDDNDDSNNDSGEDNAPSKPKPKPKPKPTKKPSKRPSKRPSRKPSKKPGKRPSNNKKKNKNKKNKKTSLKRKTNSKRRRPGKRGEGNNKKRRQNNGPYRKRNQKLSNSRRGQLNNLHAHNQGTNTYSKTETFTRTGTPNDEKDVNCIIINKTTTPRPFWGLLGRSADGDAASVERPYGRRKRINFSIPA